MNPCPVCGAEFSGEESCRTRFERCLALDYAHISTYGAVHHLVVACYMLQHNEYTRPAWLGARALVAQAIEGNVPPQDLRRQNRARLDSGQRAWKITRGEKMPGVDAIVWSRSVAHVRLETPEAYCIDVREWARSVLDDTESLVQSV